ncbi:MAG TPA: hypothetical protein VE734_09375 [Terriglobales bacterium]|nr:hypothetical protein [Terriglobales bacterium]
MRATADGSTVLGLYAAPHLHGIMFEVALGRSPAPFPSNGRGLRKYIGAHGRG